MTSKFDLRRGLGLILIVIGLGLPILYLVRQAAPTTLPMAAQSPVVNSPTPTVTPIVDRLIPTVALSAITPAPTRPVSTATLTPSSTPRATSTSRQSNGCDCNPGRNKDVIAHGRDRNPGRNEDAVAVCDGRSVGRTQLNAGSGYGRTDSHHSAGCAHRLQAAFRRRRGFACALDSTPHRFERRLVSGLDHVGPVRPTRWCGLSAYGAAVAR